MVIRVPFLQFLEGHVPLDNFVTVGSDFPGFDSPQVLPGPLKWKEKGQVDKRWNRVPLLDWDSDTSKVSSQRHTC